LYERRGEWKKEEREEVFVSDKLRGDEARTGQDKTRQDKTV
jgi:hypothetical protein